MCWGCWSKDYTWPSSHISILPPNRVDHYLAPTRARQGRGCPIAFTPLISTTSLWGRYYNSHLTQEKIEASRTKVLTPSKTDLRGRERTHTQIWPTPKLSSLPFTRLLWSTCPHGTGRFIYSAVVRGSRNELIPQKIRRPQPIMTPEEILLWTVVQSCAFDNSLKRRCIMLVYHYK